MNVVIKVFLMFTALVLCCLSGYILVGFVQKNNLNETVKKIVKKTDETSIKRYKENEEQRKLYGNQEELNLFTKLDVELEMSGLKDKFPFLNTELLLLIVFVVSVLTSAFVFIKAQSFLMAVIAFAVTIMMYRMIMLVLTEKQDRSIDNNLIQLVNQLYSYSNATSDILTIIEYALPYVDEPMRSALRQCVREARTSGNFETAIIRLNLKIRHSQFNMLMTTLLECSRNNANYKSVIMRSYESIGTYMADKEERKAQSRGAMAVIAFMGALLVVATLMIVKGFLRTSLYSFFFDSFSGQVIFTSFVFVVLFTIYKCMTMTRDKA